MTKQAERPLSVEVASWLLWLLVAAGLVTCVLVVLYRHDLDEVWSPVHSGDSTLKPVEFVPVILVLYGVIGLTVLILVQLMRQAQNWARHGLVGISLGILAGSLGTLQTDPPTGVRIGAMAGGVVAAVAVVFLWHPLTTAYIREHESTLADS